MNYFEKKKARKKVKKAEKELRDQTYTDTMTPSSDMVMSDRERMVSEAAVQPIGRKEIMEATAIMLKYKNGKANTERRNSGGREDTGKKSEGRTTRQMKQNQHQRGCLTA